MKKREPNRVWLNEVFQKGGKMNLVASQLYIREKRINEKLNQKINRLYGKKN